MAANPALIVRVAATIEELKRNLAEGVSQIETTTAGMQRLANSFSGEKLTQNAMNIVAAVNQIGGASKLTEAEQARVNATLEKALEKYRVLGKEAPAGMQALADATRGAGDATEHATGMFGGLLGRVGETAAGFLTAEVAIRTVEAALHAIVGLGEHLWETALNGAAVADVEENFKHLTTQAGFLGDELMGTLRTGTHDTVTNFELMKTVNKDLTAGMVLTTGQFGLLSKGAFALAQATGGDVKTALDTMNDAMLTGKTRALALLTGKIDLEAAETKYAASMGKTRDSLTDAGKLEAARAAILDGVTAATARLGEQTDGLDERVAQAQVAWSNFEEDLGKTIATSATLEAGLAGVKQALIDTFGGSQQTLIDAIAHQVDDAAIAVVDLGKVGVEVGGFLVKEWHATKTVFGDVMQTIDGVRLAFLLTRQAMSLGLLPGTADLQKWKELDDQIAHLEITMKARGDSLNADAGAQDRVDAATAQYVATLNALQTSMINARTNAVAFIGPLEEVKAEHGGAATAAGAHGEALTKLTAAQEAASKKLAEGITAIERNAQALSMGWVKELNEAKAKANFDQMQETVKSIATTAGLEREANMMRLALYTSDREMKIQNTHNWFDDEVAKLSASNENYQAHYDALLDLESLKIAGIETAAAMTEAAAAREVAAISKVTGSYWEQVDAAAKAAAAAAGIEFAVVGNRPGEGPGINGALPSTGSLGFKGSLGFTGFSSGAGAGILGSGAGASFPSRDAGGAVTAGQPYYIGKGAQPELFIPSSAGTMVPNGGGASITNHFYVNGTIKDLVRPLMDEITKSMKQSRQFPAA